MSLSSTPRAGNRQIILKNFFWYGLELGFGVFGALVVSIAVANTMGPTRLSDYNYVTWLTNITATLGALGLPMTTLKYMADYLNRGEAAVAKSIYRVTVWLQVMIACSVSLAGAILVLWAGNPHNRVFSLLLVACMAPRMAGFIPSQANNAAESMRPNTIATLTGTVVIVSMTIAALLLHWDLPGIAAANLTGATVEAGLKLVSVQKWLGGIPAAPLPPELRRQMFVFSTQGLGLMILNIVVWDRSDLVILKALNSDPRQITFFSTAFSLVERTLMVPSSFVNVAGVTIMAQYGRGAEKLGSLAVEAARYGFLISSPLLAGLACLSGAAVSTLYVKSYQPMIPVLAIIASLALGKTLMGAPYNLLQATANQGFLLIWTCVCGAVDIGLDVLLTPHYGAVGAAIGNGSAQVLAALGIWARAWQLLGIDLRLGSFLRIALSGLTMSAAVFTIAHVLPPHAALIAGVPAGALVWAAMLRVTGALDTGDTVRLLHSGRSLPKAAQPIWNRIVSLLAPAPALTQDA